MTAPIRDMAGLVEAVRLAKIERAISDQTLEAIAGMANGSVAKYLGPEPTKNLGPVSAILILGALGKGLAVVDDPEQMERVQGRWVKRSERGAAKVQLRKMESLLASVAGMPQNDQETLQKQVSQRMKEIRKLVSKSALSKGGKRRMKMMKKRARQAMASHAARKRWSKENREIGRAHV